MSAVQARGKRFYWPGLSCKLAWPFKTNSQVKKNGPASLATSIKSPDVLTKLIASGAAAATLPPASLAAWAGDALTDAALTQFDSDTAASLA